MGTTKIANRRILCDLEGAIPIGLSVIEPDFSNTCQSASEAPILRRCRNYAGID